MRYFLPRALSLFAVLLLSVMSSSGVFAQQGQDNTILSIERNKVDNTPISILFTATTNWGDDQAQELFAKYLGVAGDVSMRQQYSTTNKTGVTAKRYYEYYKGIKLEYASYSLSCKSGRVSFMTGNYYHIDGSTPSVASISEHDAFVKAIASVGADKYMWEFSAEEARLKAIYHNKDTSYLPKGQLTYIEDYNSDKDDRKLHLAYAFDIYARKPLSKQKVFVDAITGQILFSNSEIKHTAASGASDYSGVVPFQSAHTLGTYVLYDSTRGSGIYTTDMGNGTDYAAATDFASATNTWPTSTGDNVALDAHWGAEMVYDYWKNVQGRLSWDNADGILLNYVHYDVGYDNAFWDGAEMTYGDGSGCGGGGFTPLVSLDVTAHEIGHGVCQATCNLVYAKEPGGIDEGLSDCWGATIESYANPHETDAVAKVTWWMGEEIGCGTPLRELSFPKTKGLPDTYLGTNWYSVTSCTPGGGNDQCGVHTNMGVISKWYYLITNGGSGTNDLAHTYSITGLGFTESENILYQTELVLANTATYSVLRTTSINTAITLYGACSNEVQVVTNAWYAVGVGAAYVPSPAAITGTVNICVGSSGTLSDATFGGTWGTSAIGTASVSGGTVLGASAGTAVITYTLGGFCYSTSVVTVNALPFIYNVTGGGNYCIGGTGVHVGLSGSTAGISYQLYYLGSTIGSPVTGTGGLVDFGLQTNTGISAYTVVAKNLTTGCTSNMSGTATILTNPLPNSSYTVTGGGSLCAGGTGVAVGLSNTDLFVTYQLYVSGTTAVGTGVAGTGAAITTLGTVTTGGPYTVVATNSTGCTATMTGTVNVVVNPLPAAITGTPTLCVGTTTTLNDGTPGGTWSSSSSSAPVVGGTVTGVGLGTASISYTLGTGCYATAEVTVVPFPSPISGALGVCEGATTSLSTTVTGGTWTSSNTTSGTVDAASGMVSGLTPGNTDITYTISSGCTVTANVTVNVLPSAISGGTTFCTGTTSLLSDGGGGTWNSSSTAIATVDGTGLVTGVGTGGVATITYTLPTGCATSTNVTVNATIAAPVTGPGSVCVGQTITLGDLSTGGVWNSSDVTKAIVTSSGGTVTGLSAGSLIISYTVSGTCGTAVATASLTVNTPPVVAAIIGSATVCSGGASTLSDATTGGVWSSSNTTVATISTAGRVSALTLGTSNISYTVTNIAGCSTTATDAFTVFSPFTVSVTPAGPVTICSGADVVLSTAPTAGMVYQWKTGGVNIPGAISASYTATTGGSYTLLMTAAGGCNSTSSPVVVNLSSSPVVIPAVSILASPGSILCVTTAPVTFTPIPVNGGTPSYLWYVNSTLVGSGGTYSYTPASGDIVKCEMTSTATCAFPAVAESSVTMTISPMETPAVSVTADHGFTICTGQTDTVSAIPLFGGVSPSYVWSRNGINIATGPKYGGTFSNGDIIVCKMTSDFPCLLTNTAVSSSYIMHVELPTVNFVNISVSQSSILSGSVDSFVAVAPNAGSAPIYQWLKNGVAIPGANASLYVTSTLAAGDEISCRVTSSDVCATPNIATSSAVTVTVRPNGVAQVSAQGNKFVLQPNPNKGEFTITGSLGAADEQLTIVVTDVLGQNIYSGKGNAQSGSVNERITLPGTVANGIYLVTVTSGGDRTVFRMVVDK